MCFTCYPRPDIGIWRILAIVAYSGFRGYELVCDCYSRTSDAVAIVSDFVVPVLGVKLFNGTANGKWGSFIGGIAGLFFMPIGIIAGPFLGALLGELIGGQQFEFAMKSATGSLIGFLCGTLIKIVAVIYIGFLAIMAVGETVL